MTNQGKPRMNPGASEASEHQLYLAREQGAAYARALGHMAATVAYAGGEQEAGQFFVGYAVEKAEGMYEWVEGELVWRPPSDADNIHLEITVRDASAGRFIPGAAVGATLVGEDGTKVGPQALPLLWHPMLYRYGANLSVPADGSYTPRAHVEPPRIMRCDETDGCRFTEAVDVRFDAVSIATGPN